MPERHYVVPSSFVPYIYTRDEMRRLLAAIPSIEHSHRETDTETLKMIILFLYATGVSTGDMLRIQHICCHARRAAKEPSPSST